MKKKVDLVGSIQEVLWNYLREEQQRRVAMVLGSLKKGSQQEVCVALVDYMETGVMVMACADALSRVARRSALSIGNDVWKRLS